MRIIAAIALVTALAGCQNSVENPELNQCAQQRFACEAKCETSTVDKSMTAQVCEAKCDDTFTQCRDRAQKLGEVE